MNGRILNKTFGQLQSVDWQTRIKQSYLDETTKIQYRGVVEYRMSALTG